MNKEKFDSLTKPIQNKLEELAPIVTEMSQEAADKNSLLKNYDENMKQILKLFKQAEGKEIMIRLQSMRDQMEEDLTKIAAKSEKLVTKIE